MNVDWQEKNFGCYFSIVLNQGLTQEFLSQALINDGLIISAEILF